MGNYNKMCRSLLLVKTDDYLWNVIKGLHNRPLETKLHLDFSSRRIRNDKIWQILLLPKIDI